MNEPKAMREVHAIREKMSREINGMTVEEQAAYWERKSKNTEAYMLKLGYKYVPVEGKPGVMRMERA